MRNCFVPMCDAVCRNMPKRMMFIPPKNKDIFNKWREKLPKKREFKEQDRVCERHFRKTDIITTWDHVINGVLHQLPRGKPRLNPTAIPELNLPEIDEKLCTRGKRKRDGTELKEKVINEKRTRSVNVVKNEKITDEKSNIKHLANEEYIEPTEEEICVEIINNFDVIYEDIYEVILPNTLWALHRDPERNFIAFTLFDERCMGAIKILYITNKLESKFYVRNKMVVYEKIETLTTDYLTNLLSEIEEYKLCPNIFKEISLTTDCEGVTKDKLCLSCETKII